MKSPLDSSSSSAPELLDHRPLTARGFAHGFLLLLVIALLLGIGVRFLARHSWFCELSTAFTLPQFTVSLLVLAGLVSLRAWRSSVPALVCVLWLGALVASDAPWRAVHPVDAVGQPLRVLLTNVFTHNRDFTAVRRMIEESHPDVICAQEIDAPWEKQFEALQASYPYHHSIPRNDNFGIGVWSRFPLRDVRVENLGDSTVPAIQAILDINGSPVTLLTVHTLPPLLRDYADTRNAQLAGLARLAAEIRGPAIVVGDLNVTPWSPYFRDMLKESGLRSARQGQGIFPTWPVDNPWLPALCPIDHILVTPNILVARFTRGPRVGSDHHPVWADLLIPAQGPGGTL